MPSKKQSRRKLDLTHLGSLNTSVTPEPTKVELEKVEPAKVELEKVEPTKVELEKVEPTKVELEKVEPTKVELEKVVEDQPTHKTVIETPVAPQAEPAPAAPEEAPTEGRQFDRRPQRYEVKPLKTLASSTNSAGESFQPGDKIQLTAPWGKKAIAEITQIYQDESANAWVHYLPVEEIPPHWSWLGGCTRAERIVLAS